jgi:hypothetical protein
MGLGQDDAMQPALPRQPAAPTAVHHGGTEDTEQRTSKLEKPQMKRGDENPILPIRVPLVAAISLLLRVLRASVVNLSLCVGSTNTIVTKSDGKYKFR